MSQKTVAFNKRLKNFKETILERMSSYNDIIQESRLSVDTENLSAYLEEVKNLQLVLFKSEMLRHRLIYLKKNNPEVFSNDIIISRFAQYLGEEDIDLLETLDCFSAKFITKVREEKEIRKQATAYVEPSVVSSVEEVAVSSEEVSGHLLEFEDAGDMVQLELDLFA